MIPELTIHCPGKWLWKFNTLLQKGVRVECLANRCLLAILKEDFHLDDNYIRQRIQTITLDGQPVDDPANATVLDEAILAISGAMPGLVGATLRKGGYYAAMRSSISYSNCNLATENAQAGMVTVKLFNLILKDLAAAFLARGVGITGAALVPLLDELMALLEDPSGRVVLKGQKMEWPSVRGICLEKTLVFITVEADESTD